LLDTHAFLWWMTDDKRLSRTASRFVADPENTSFLSASSVWEIATKFRIGKLPSATTIIDDIEAALASQRFESMNITLAHAHRAGLLPGPLQDPFDRILIAQAQAEDLALVSNEQVFDRYGVRRIW
jgi:PIN domain nuclease of toxin-antitoxin system